MMEHLTKEERDKLRDNVQSLILTRIDLILADLESELWEIIRLERTFLIPMGVDKEVLLWLAKEELRKWL